ncbi:hypothetical protein [Actinomadura fibrosa]|uniref:PH domain-containing protein n=1 Tax=Actinomadura fibrosa TaxID=111802 RepID=A0ABW2XTJ4_9ACTN|nr:hypothetical protein [Actinomadura fibrosa]
MQQERDLGVDGEAINPTTRAGRWINLGFLAFLTLAFGAGAAGGTAQGKAAALPWWPVSFVLAVVWFHCWRYYLRQRARLHGTVLTVTDLTGTRRCDLARARDMTLRGAVFGLGGSVRDQAVPVLFARDPDEKRPVRLALRNRHGGPMTADDLRSLADAIEGRPRTLADDPQAISVLRELRGGDGSWTNHPDWSHRKHG